MLSSHHRIELVRACVLARACVLVLACSRAPAAAAAPPAGAWRGQAAKARPADAVRSLERITVSLSDELLGTLAPDGRHIYFVSNRNATNQLFTLDLERAGDRLLFDEGADVSWPRVSPDGKRLLYISFRDDAAGQLCVRTLPKLERRCLEGTSAIQAQWLPGGHELLLVGRSSLHGDLELLRVDKDAHHATPVGLRNLSSPTVSPDGRWLLYVPIERYAERVGVGFAARAAPRLEAVRLDRGANVATPIHFALPGVTGQPAFSYDGQWVYFTQFVDDTNHDGHVDGDDHGVLYRVPWGAGDDAPGRAAAAEPEQLTNAGWTCQYPSPTADRVIATCARSGSLDIYSLPLDGIIPAEWSQARLREELSSSQRRLEQLLLLARLHAREPAGPARTALGLALEQLHLQMGDYESAAFHARALAPSSGETQRLSVLLETQVAQRRAVRALEAGRLSTRFLDETRARLESVMVTDADSKVAMALGHLVRSEIATALGDQALARRELEAVPLADDMPRWLLTAAAERADALYRLLDERDALIAVYRRLAGHPALEEAERLAYARSAVRALGRGRALEEAQAAMEEERARLKGDTEWQLVLDAGHWMARLTRDPVAKEVKDAVMDLYARQASRARRRTLIAIAVKRASEVGAEELLDELVGRYVNDVPRGSTERRRAERMYRQVTEERAYAQLEAGELAGAREDFEAVVARADSLESYVALIEIRLAEGARDLVAEFDRRFADRPRSPVPHFVRAYLLARRLPDLTGAAFDDAVERALSELSIAALEFKQKSEVQALTGALLHAKYLRTRELDLAEEANVHYLLALDLAHENPRYRAMVLEELGQLQSATGNFRIALEHFAERERLPFASPLAAVAHQLASARAHLHQGRDAEAARLADQALALVETNPKLERFHALALDRAALYHLSAGQFARAVELYARLLPLVPGGAASARNRLVNELSHAAAALGAGRPREALADLGDVDRCLADPRELAALKWPHVETAEVLAAYRTIAFGLRARAHREVGELDAAERALLSRRALLELKLKRTNVDEDVAQVAEADAQLAEVARARGDVTQAVKFVEEGLARAEELRRRTDTPVLPAELDLLAFAVELYLHAGVPLARFSVDLPAKVSAAGDRLFASGNPAWRQLGRRFDRYATIFRLDGVAPRSGGP